jgi:hypothetical protein
VGYWLLSIALNNNTYKEKICSQLFASHWNCEFKYIPCAGSRDSQDPLIFFHSNKQNKNIRREREKIRKILFKAKKIPIEFVKKKKNIENKRRSLSDVHSVKCKEMTDKYPPSSLYSRGSRGERKGGVRLV